MNNIISKLKKIGIIILITLIYSVSFSNAEIYKEIKVEGNERLAVETVIMFSGLKVGQDLTNDDLNNSIKNLH